MIGHLVARDEVTEAHGGEGDEAVVEGVEPGDTGGGQDVLHLPAPRGLQAVKDGSWQGKEDSHHQASNKTQVHAPAQIDYKTTGLGGGN